MIKVHDDDLEPEEPISTQVLMVLLIDDICLTTNIGSNKALMSSEYSKKLYCLNIEHSVPQNEFEESRIIQEIAFKQKSMRPSMSRG